MVCPWSRGLAELRHRGLCLVEGVGLRALGRDLVAGMDAGRPVAGDAPRHRVRDAGVPDTVARSISGHRTPSVHARYQITAESTQADALDKAEAAVAKLSRPA